MRIDPPNRFEAIHAEDDLDHVEWDAEYFEQRQLAPITYFDDASQSIVSENDSPDIPFRYSVNPYRGCVHACAYCYARNTHEYLGLNAGLDFETKIMVKRNAPQLLRAFLSKKSWRPEPIMFSGVTDCYQPAERGFRLTRACLEVMSAYAQPVNVITKNALVVRDLDILRSLAERRLVQVNISLTTLDPALARDLEPRTSIPAARLRAISELTAAGVPVRVMTAPLIPGLNDHELPALLAAARSAGAQDARYILLRLPLTVEPVFRDWLERARPLQREKIEARVRATRRGEMSASQWGERMRGTGEIAEQIQNLYQVVYRQQGFQPLAELDCTQFRVPEEPGGQRRLF